MVCACLLTWSFPTSTPSQSPKVFKNTTSSEVTNCGLWCNIKHLFFFSNLKNILPILTSDSESCFQTWVYQHILSTKCIIPQDHVWSLSPLHAAGDERSLCKHTHKRSLLPYTNSWIFSACKKVSNNAVHFWMSSLGSSSLNYPASLYWQVYHGPSSYHLQVLGLLSTNKVLNFFYFFLS